MMNDSPGWASPGSSPSDEDGREKSGPTPPPGPGGGPASGGLSDWGGAGSWGGQGGPGGWGGQGGWGSGWAQPPAAKPGIIPLRPLGVGEILDGAVSTMRAHWRTVLGVSLVVAVLTQSTSTLVNGLWFRDATSLEGLENNPNPTFDETLDALGGTFSSTGLTWLISMLGTIIATAMLTIVVSRAVLGRSVSTSEAWRGSRSQLPRLFGLLFLIPLLILGVAAAGVAPGMILSQTGNTRAGAALALFGGLVGVVAAIWLWIRYSLSAAALMLERQGVIASMRRSAKLVRRAWWRVFGIQLLTVILITVVSAVIEVPVSIIGVFAGGDGAMDLFTGESSAATWPFLIIVGIGAVLSSTITLPISAGVTALLYMDQRIRREALDLELARAAGVPGYGEPEPSGPQKHDTAPGS
ncbi:hypothetical protein [Streptomyces sp. NPDC051776]|uniref:DUF7544 domain-containing protein n=1 Tax=Streptomyces sp. NPDC051776 TaxID=3155414 RepID=UPI0034395CDD